MSTPPETTEPFEPTLEAPKAPGGHGRPNPFAAMAKRPLWQIFLIFLGPMMLANILQAASGTVNSVFLGQMIGVQALAAATAFFPVMFFLISFLMGMGSGAAILIGQAFGAGETDRVRAIAGTTLSVVIPAGFVVGVLGVVFAKPMMVALATPPDIVDAAAGYAAVLLGALPLMFVFFILTQMLRGVGDTVTPLWTLVVSTTVGLVVTPALIQGWGGLPKLGVASAAWAGIAGMIVAMVWLVLRLRKLGSPFAPGSALFAHLKVQPTILKATLKLGLPTALNMIVMSIAELVLLGIVNGYGSNATAAYGAVNQVLSYLQFPAMSIGITASILGAQAIGAGAAERLRPIVRTGLIFNIVLTGGLIVVAYLLSETLMRAFITDPAVIELAQRLLHIVLWSTLLFGMAGVLTGIMRASGVVLWPTAISIGILALVEIPLALVLSRTVGLDGVWIAYAATFTAMFLIHGAYYRWVWRRKPIARIALG